MDNVTNNKLGEDFYKRLVQETAVAMLAADASFRVVCCNTAAGKLLGEPPGNVVGRPLSELVPPDRRDLAEKLLHRTADKGMTTQFDFRMTNREGKTLNMLAILAPVPGSGGQGPQGVSAWIVDETQHVHLLVRLAQAEKLASLGTLASGVAHHFNNILGGVATFVDFALTSGDVASMKRALQMTSEAAARAARITQQLLSFAQKDSHRTDLADLTEVVLTFVHLVERPLAQKNIKLQLNLQPAAIVPVEANRMHQALGNMLTNAEEAMPTGGTIILGVKQVGDEVHLTFSDSGCGIKAEALPLVFEPFFTTKGLHAGGGQPNPGLGLSVVHGIVTEMGGRIEVASTAGIGTTFTLRFPVTHCQHDE